eukprot:355240-Chlamydomonas_euryale.AAC.4
MASLSLRTIGSDEDSLCTHLLAIHAHTPVRVALTARKHAGTCIVAGRAASERGRAGDGAIGAARGGRERARRAREAAGCGARRRAHKGGTSARLVYRTHRTTGMDGYRAGWVQWAWGIQTSRQTTWDFV